MGIILVYDITSAKTFENISKWLRNIDEVTTPTYSTSANHFTTNQFTDSFPANQKLVLVHDAGFYTMCHFASVATHTNGYDMISVCE